MYFLLWFLAVYRREHQTWRWMAIRALLENDVPQPISWLIVWTRRQAAAGGSSIFVKKRKIYYFTSVYLFYSIIKQEANTDILARARMFCFTHLFCQLSLRNNWHCLQSIIAVWIHFEIIWGHLPILWPPLWACVLLEYITNDVQYKWRPESLFNWYRFKDVYLLGWLKTEFKRRRNRSLFCV